MRLYGMRAPTCLGKRFRFPFSGPDDADVFSQINDAKIIPVCLVRTMDLTKKKY